MFDVSHGSSKAVQYLGYVEADDIKDWIVIAADVMTLFFLCSELDK